MTKFENQSPSQDQHLTDEPGVEGYFHITEDDLYSSHDNQSGESAARSISSEIQRQEDDADATFQLFVEYDIEGVTPADLSDLAEKTAYIDWLASLGQVDREILNERKSLRAHFEVVKQETLKTAPTLFEGKLPEKQAEKLGSDRYVIGVNQSGTTSTNEAIESIHATNGIELGIYNLAQRFLLFDRAVSDEDPHYVDQILVGGYYDNSSIGRFIIAIPMDDFMKDRASDYVYSEANNAWRMIDDFVQTTSVEGGRSISPKYIAGYIDDTGKYNENKNFGLSARLEFVDS